MNISDINQEPPKIEFPCAYPIKVLGFANTTFQAEVLAVIHRYASSVPAEKVTERGSAKGNYVSVTVIIEATGEDQIKNIFEDLMEQENVKLVL